MEDQDIVQLYWDRDPDAIPETSRKYGSYCRAIAVNVLGSPEDAGGVRQRHLSPGMERHAPLPPLFPLRVSRQDHAESLSGSLVLPARREAGRPGSCRWYWRSSLSVFRAAAAPKRLWRGGSSPRRHRGLPRGPARPEKQAIFLRRYFFTEPVSAHCPALRDGRGRVPWPCTACGKRSAAILRKGGFIHERGRSLPGHRRNL